MADKKVKTPEEAAKEKKQLIFLGCMLGLAGVYFTFTGLIKPQLKAYEELKTKVVETKNRLALMKSTVSGKRTLDRLCYESLKKVDHLTDIFFPPRENSILWLQNLVDDVADSCGVSTDERSCKQVGVKTMISAGKESLVEDYDFQVSINSDLHTFGCFVGEVERRIPFCYVTNVSIVKGKDRKITGSFNCIIPRLTNKGVEEFGKLAEMYKTAEGEK